MQDKNTALIQSVRDQLRDCSATELQDIASAIIQDLAQKNEIGDPVQLDLGNGIDIEIGNTDQRVTVGKQGFGFTTVNYTGEGLVLDVYDAGDLPENVHTASIFNEDLERVEDEDSYETPSA